MFGTKTSSFGFGDKSNSTPTSTPSTSSFIFGNNTSNNNANNITQQQQQSQNQQQTFNSPAANGAFGSSLFPPSNNSNPPSFSFNKNTSNSTGPPQPQNLFAPKPAVNSLFAPSSAPPSNPIDTNKAPNSSTGGGLFSLKPNNPASSSTPPALNGLFARSSDTQNNTSFSSTNGLPSVSASPPILPSLTAATEKFSFSRNGSSSSPSTSSGSSSKTSAGFSRVMKERPLNQLSTLKSKSRFKLSSSRSSPYSSLTRSDTSRDLFLKSVASTNPPNASRFSTSKNSSFFLNEGRRSEVKKLVITKNHISSEDIRGIKAAPLLKHCQSSESILASTPVKHLPADVTTSDIAPSPRTHTPLKRVYEINKTAEDEGYWIYPPLKDLFSYSFDQLASVPDLAIGRKGHGKIQFTSPVNLSEIRNLGDIMGNLVVFDGTIVCVYPDDKEKVPVGSGLNVPAIVTLENIFIKQVVGPKTFIVKDPTNTRAVRQMAILRHNIENRGGEFITYDVSHGIFVFKVPHFSTWGFMEEDLVYDDDEIKDFDMDSLPPQEPVPIHSVDSIHHLVPSEIQIQDLAFGLPHQDSQHPDNDTILRLNLNTSDSNSFPEDTFANRVQKGNVFPPDLAIASTKYQHSESGDTEKDGNKGLVSINDSNLLSSSNNQDALQLIQKPVDDQHFDLLDLPVNASSDDWVQQLELASNLTSAFATYDTQLNYQAASDEVFSAADLDQTMFGGIDTLNKTSTTAQYALAAEKLRLVPAFEPDTFAKFSLNDQLLIRDSTSPSGFKISSYKDNTKPSTIKLLDNISQATHFESRENGFPKASPSPTVNFQFLATHLTDVLTNKKEGELWNLGSILFDPLPTLGLQTIPNEFSEPAKEKLESQHRTKLLSNWLKGVVSEDVTKLISAAASSLDSAFAYLSGGQISRAAVVAAGSKNLHLATLISLLGTDDLTIRRSAQAQLNDWSNSGSLQFIPTTVRKVYELLAGNTTISRTGSPPVYLYDTLSWQQSFGLRLWYSSTINEDISIAVKKYEESFRQQNSRVPSPFTQNSKHADVEFELLKLFGSINPQPENALNASPYLLDSWIPWVLHSVLFRSLKCFKDEKGIFGDQLSLNFALQLESDGYVTESAFVLAHLENDDLAKRCIQNLLGRQVEKLSSTVVQQLLHIGIEKSIVFESIALQRRYNGQSLDECISLIDAKQWDEAHLVLIKSVAPKAVVSNDISELFNVLMKFPDPSIIADWKKGGQVYLDYVRLVEKLSPSQAAFNDYGLPDLSAKSLSANLIKGLAEISVGSNFSVQVATTLMSSFVGKHLKSLGLSSLSSNLLHMQMDSNEFLQQTLQISVSYFENQVAA